MRYEQHFSTQKTPQSEQADPRQVPNSAGGFTFKIDAFARLHRWLILGAEGGTYYTTERALTVENAKTIVECIAADPKRTIDKIVEVSKAGRAPKNDPAIFALALAAGAKDPLARKLALAALPEVCRTGTHLFHFVSAVRAFRGFGKGLRKALAGWYEAQSEDDLAYQVVKYQSRDGWSHKDVLRLCHATSAKHAHTYRWIAARSAGFDLRTVKRKDGKAVEYPALGTESVPRLLRAYDEVLLATTAQEIVRLIKEHKLTHEMVPSQWKKDREVMLALFEHMPLGALVRQLGVLTANEVLKPMSKECEVAVQRLTDPVALGRARIHPIGVLAALSVYAQGHGERGKLHWSPLAPIVDALDQAFYLSFGNVEPTNARTMLAFDCSASMNSGLIAGVPGLTPRVGVAAMGMVTARVEKNWMAVAFTAGGPGSFTAGSRPAPIWGGYGAAGHQTSVAPLAITPRQRLDDIVKTMQGVPFGGTDCALPMLYALEKRIPIDLFVVYTDNETWAGDIHPHQALLKYRDMMGIPARLAVVGMTATEFSIASPSDAGMLDVVGFDTAAPNVLADFARGG